MKLGGKHIAGLWGAREGVGIRYGVDRIVFHSCMCEILNE